MINLTSFGYYLTIGATITLPTISVSIGQGLASKAILNAINRQPSAKAVLNRIFIIAMAFSETAAILAVLMSIMMLVSPTTSGLQVIAQCGAAAAITIPAAVVGIVSAWPIIAAFNSVARQPLFDRKILNLLLISLAIIQTPVIFGLVIGWLILNQGHGVATIVDALKLCAAGLSIGIGAIGPSIGLALFSEQACASIGTNRHAYDKILSFTLISQALIETPILFSLVTSLLLIFTQAPVDAGLFKGIAYMASAFTIGLATLGTGIASGRTARAACAEIGSNTKMYPFISRLSLLSQTLIDTNAIYGLIIVLFMIFKHG